MRIKRIAELLLLCMLLLLSGCSSEPEPITEITFLHGWGSTEADHETMRRIYRDFELENPDIKLNMVSMPTSDEVVRKTEDMVMVGDVPDVIFLGGRGVDSIYRYMVEHEYALDLTPYLREDAAFAESLAAANLEQWTTADGALYTVSDVLMLCGGYWYNAEIFAQAGVTETPQTWDALESACEKIAAWAEQTGSGVQPMHLSSEGYQYFMDQILAASDPEALEDTSRLRPDALFHALDILERLQTYSGGRSDKYTYRDETSLFNDGKLAIYVNGVWGAAMIDDALDVRYALLPAVGESICCESAGAGYVLGRTGDPVRQAASIRFLKYMLSEPVQTRILLETQQVPANPNIRIADYEPQMPRLSQAVETAQQAQIKIEIPEQIWTDAQLRVFSEHIFDVLSGDFNRQTFYDLLR